MTKMVESPATTINRQTAGVHDTDKVNHSETIDDCFISRKTWSFLALVLAWNDLYGKVSDALIAMYGEKQGEEIIKEEFDKTSKKVESILYGFVNDSIRENICIIGFNKI